MKKIFWLIGEKSGENIASQILNTIQEDNIISNVKLEMIGVVGNKMQLLGVKPIFNISEISVMGLFEIVTYLPKLIKKIIQTVKNIIQFNPDIFISIDSYYFCYIVAILVKLYYLYDYKFYGNINYTKFIHVVAPKVWLYNSGRARSMAKIYNTLLCILPFEPQYFEKYGLKSYFIGNPALNNYNFIDISHENVDKNLIAITIGSRIPEIEKHHKLIQDIIYQLTYWNKNLKFFISTTDNTYDNIKEIFKNFTNITISCDDIEKNKIIPKCVFAIAKSGTNAVEFSCAKVPMLVYYKISNITYFLLKIAKKINLFNIKYINLINIISDKKIIPELINNEANADNIVNITKNYLENADLRNQQIFDSNIAINQIKCDNFKDIIKTVFCS